MGKRLLKFEKVYRQPFRHTVPAHRRI